MPWASLRAVVSPVTPSTQPGSVHLPSTAQWVILSQQQLPRTPASEQTGCRVCLLVAVRMVVSCAPGRWWRAPAAPPSSVTSGAALWLKWPGHWRMLTLSLPAWASVPGLHPASLHPLHVLLGLFPQAWLCVGS